MSGVAAGIAYCPDFRHSPYWPGIARVWHRVWTLYLVHLALTVWALGIASAAALWLGSTQSISVNEIDKLFERPLGFLIGVPLLTHQIGYVNILPMYAVLLAAAPAMLWLGLRRPWLLLALSVLLWVATGLFEWNLPNWPNEGGWFFNPLAWQIIFVIGLLTGIAHRQGRRFVPVSRGLQMVAGPDPGQRSALEHLARLWRAHQHRAMAGEPGWPAPIPRLWRQDLCHLAPAGSHPGARLSAVLLRRRPPCRGLAPGGPSRADGTARPAGVRRRAACWP